METELGKLVQFEQRQHGKKAVKSDRLGNAEILIFTGVRYEREPASLPPKPSATPRAKRKRG